MRLDICSLDDCLKASCLLMGGVLTFCSFVRLLFSISGLDVLTMGIDEILSSFSSSSSRDRYDVIPCLSYSHFCALKRSFHKHGSLLMVFHVLDTCDICIRDAKSRNPIIYTAIS